MPGLLRLEIEGEHTVTCEGLLALKQHCGKLKLIAVGTDNDSNHWWKSDIVVLRQALLSALSGWSSLRDAVLSGSLDARLAQSELGHDNDSTSGKDCVMIAFSLVATLPCKS